MQSLKQRSNIESNKAFQRLAEKTQVLMPRCGMKEVAKNRYSHSYEVATSSLMIASTIADSLNVPIHVIDYEESLFNVSLLHDIGHPSFGHDGVDLLDNYFKDLGLVEGFSDNNNNLVVIEKNNIYVSDYVIASVIKYPNKLYPDQMIKYLPILKSAIKKDYNHFKHNLKLELKNQTKTIACQIMDEADRNSYVCSDLTDFLCLGNSISLEELKDHARKYGIVQYDELSALAHVIKGGSKNAIKSYFNILKNRFNENYKLSENGIEVIDKDLAQYREFLSSVEHEFYIKPIRKLPEHFENMEKMKKFIVAVVQDGIITSKHYRKKINSTDDKIKILTYQRDMIGEVTDWYILNYFGKEIGC